MNDLDHAIIRVMEVYFENWKPTPFEINKLPEKVKSYIHDLETNADPAGTIRENTIAKDSIKSIGIGFVDTLESIQDELRDLENQNESAEINHWLKQNPKLVLDAHIIKTSDMIAVLDRYIIEYEEKIK